MRYHVIVCPTPGGNYCAFALVKNRDGYPEFVEAQAHSEEGVLDHLRKIIASPSYPAPCPIDFQTVIEIDEAAAEAAARIEELEEEIRQLRGKSEPLTKLIEPVKEKKRPAKKYKENDWSPGQAKFTEDQIDTMRKMRKAGNTLAEIAQVVGCSTSTAKRYTNGF